jgi:hypothetical protein
MTDRSRAGERQNPQSEWRLKARFADWEPIRGVHQGQRLDQNAALTGRTRDRVTAHDSSIASPEKFPCIAGAVHACARKDGGQPIQKPGRVPVAFLPPRAKP